MIIVFSGPGEYLFAANGNKVMITTKNNQKMPYKYTFKHLNKLASMQVDEICFFSMTTSGVTPQVTKSIYEFSIIAVLFLLEKENKRSFQFYSIPFYSKKKTKKA